MVQRQSIQFTYSKYIPLRSILILTSRIFLPLRYGYFCTRFKIQYSLFISEQHKVSCEGFLLFCIFCMKHINGMHSGKDISIQTPVLHCKLLNQASCNVVCTEVNVCMAMCLSVYIKRYQANLILVFTVSPSF